jgi:hypothetical protein
MPDYEVPVGKITETLQLIKSRYKQLSLPELKKVRRYVNDAWPQLWPSYRAGGYKNLAEREALQLVIDLRIALEVELDAQMAAATRI